MAENEAQPAKRRRITAAHIVIALVVAIVAAMVFFRLIVKSRLDRRMDAIRAAGYPATPAELDDWYAIPPNAENAADVILEAISHQSKPQEPNIELLPIVGRAELPPRTEALDDQTRTLIARHLAANKKALELLHGVAGMQHGRYPIDLSAGFAATWPSHVDIRHGARLLALEAVLHAEQADSARCVESLRSALGVGRSLAKEPIIASQLFRLSCNALAVSALKRAINRVEFTDEQLASLGSCFSAARDDSAMARAFAGERCCALPLFKDPRLASSMFGSYNAPPAALFNLYRAVGLADVGAMAYIDFIDAYIDATKLAPQQRQEVAGAIDGRLKETPKIHALVRAIVPAFSRVVTIDVREMAALRTAHAAIAVERYRLATAELPQMLAELVPTYLDAVPKDPFDGNDLRYRPLEAGFIVYSVGEDGKDDGGTERPRRRQDRSKPWDVTFIVER
ncbi:MAG: hypothetical protein JSU94_12320 [Phycisphaerales bacterium]|nr:MAG: hypothetical protein JSU94_12320 [Phycisphaerales bacterium]